jgi:cytidine deaminase
MNEKELVALALKARKNSYCPYSHWAVGAALLAKNGEVYLGCNIENAAYSPTNCAERTAFFKAVSEGVREFEAIAIVGGREGEEPSDYCGPCGVCRQVMMEFCNPETFWVIAAVSPERYRVYALAELLPLGFGPQTLV